MPVKPLQSVNNALAVVEALSRAQPAGVTALARACDLDKMAVQRVLVTLERRGWARQPEGPGGPWELTSLPLQIAGTSSSALRDAARPHLEWLASESGETVLLFRREGARLVVIDGVDSHQALRMTVPIGTEAPLVRTGALDAFLSDEERDALSPGPVEVSDRQREATRAAGYYVVDGMYPHSAAVGAPLRDGSGRVIGTLLVVGPRERLPRSTFPALGALVRQAADAVTARWTGCQPRWPGTRR
jgi:IclR family acetate operon transcriptional repressor